MIFLQVCTDPSLQMDSLVVHVTTIVLPLWGTLISFALIKRVLRA